jgi:hypothetical protein
MRCESFLRGELESYLSRSHGRALLWLMQITCRAGAYVLYNLVAWIAIMILENLAKNILVEWKQRPFLLFVAVMTLVSRCCTLHVSYGFWKTLFDNRLIDYR